LNLSVGYPVRIGCRKEKVAVLNFKNFSDLKPEDVDYLTDDVVRGEIRKRLPADRFFVVTRESLETFLSDRGLKLEDACEGSCEVDVELRKGGGSLAGEYLGWPTGLTHNHTLGYACPQNENLFYEKE